MTRGGVKVRRGSNLAAGALVAMLVVAPVGNVAARNIVTATINGKRHKWKGRYVLFEVGPSGVIAVASKRARLGSILPTIGFACPVLLSGATFPLMPDPAICNATYTETKVSRTPATKAWLATRDVQVTYASFDGTRLTGTFAAVLDPVPGNPSPAVTVEGQFRGKVTAGR